MQGCSIKQVVGFQLLPCRVQHRLRGINRHEAPAWFKVGHGDDLLRRTAGADHQYLGRRGIAKARREHAGCQILARVIARQRDTALSRVLVGS